MTRWSVIALAGMEAPHRHRAPIERLSQEGAVVMTNGDDGRRLIEEILRAIARARGWPGYEVGRVQRVAWSGERLERLAGPIE